MTMQRKRPAGPPKSRPASGQKRPSAPKKKAVPVKRSLQRREPARVRCEAAPPEVDAAGRVVKRPYKLESLVSAIERSIERQERVFEPVLHDALGQAPIASLTLAYESENDHRLVFRLNAALTNRKRGNFMFVIAKRDVDKSDLQRQEHENLINLYRRMPKHCLRPYRASILYLPDRLGRTGKGRQLHWYLTQSWSACREVHAGPNGQFIITADRPRLCSAAATDTIRAAICEAIVRSYDPENRTCLQPPILLQGEYIADQPAKGGKPRVYPAVCRKLAQNVNPVMLIDMLAGAGHAYEDGVYQTIPESPREFLKALARPLGHEQALGWLQAYAVALSTRRVKVKPGLPADMLRELLAEE